MARHRVLVSAHRCGYAELGAVGAARGAAVEGIAHSAEVGADYCEFDVRRCTRRHLRDLPRPRRRARATTPADRASWPGRSCTSGRPASARSTELLAALGPTGMGAHVDMKFAHPAREREAGGRWEIDLLAIHGGLPRPRPDRRDHRQRRTTTGACAPGSRRTTCPSSSGSASAAACAVCPGARPSGACWGELFPRRGSRLARPTRSPPTSPSR